MDIRGKNVAILVTDGFEQVELTEPKKALEAAGATTQIVSPLAAGNGPQSSGGAGVKGWQKTEWGDTFPIDLALDRARASDFDALLLPGGVLSPDKLRTNPQALELVRAFVAAGKPIAAICHGPMTLIEVGAVKGKTMTSFPSIKTDLTNAGAQWVDEEVVVDGNLVTSRKPDDIPAFNREMLRVFALGNASASRPAASGPSASGAGPAPRA